MIKIIDDFIPHHQFRNIENCIYDIPWSFGTVGIQNDPNDVMLCDPLDNFQFVHLFYKDYEITSQHCNLILPIIQKLNLRALIKIKANLNPRTSKIIEHTFHRDVDYDDSFTSVYYVNSNDGYTLFEDGTKVESVGNRMVIFPSNMMHTGSTCTNQKARVVINFNYF